MGKASRRTTSRRTVPTGPAPAPFVARPFAGLAGETDWVAMREILPAATAVLTLAQRRVGEVELPETFTAATVLPMAWPAMHRADGTIFVSTQSGNVSGDASRDIVAALLTAAGAPAGEPTTVVPGATVDTPRLQDLIDPAAPMEVTLHEGFDFWVAEADLTDEARASLASANEAVLPTARLSAAPSAYWVAIGDRSYVRWALPHDEDVATAALARLVAADEHRLGAAGRLLGAFRASGLLIPVWEVDPGAEPDSHDPDLGALAARLATALARHEEPLGPQERRARSGLLSRQVTLR